MDFIRSTFCAAGECVEATFVRSSFCASGTCVEAAYVGSTFCGAGTCVEAAYVGSSFCADKSCVQAAGVDGRVLLRDGKDPAGPVLEFTRGQWGGFLEAIRSGSLDDL